MPHLSIRGLQMHIGSQLTEVQPFVDAIVKVSPIVRKFIELYGIEFWSIGGGIGIMKNTLGGRNGQSADIEQAFTNLLGSGSLQSLGQRAAEGEHLSQGHIGGNIVCHILSHSDGAAHSVGPGSCGNDRGTDIVGGNFAVLYSGNGHIAAGPENSLVCSIAKGSAGQLGGLAQEHINGGLIQRQTGHRHRYRG